MLQLGYAICQKPEKIRFYPCLEDLLQIYWSVFGSMGDLHNRLEFFGVTVYFPFNLATDQDIPYHRWQSVRLALFAIFAFYGFMHLLHGSREVYPVHFLKTYLFALCFVGVGICLQEGVDDLEYLLPARFFWVAVLLHFATGMRLRRYFSKNNRPWATPVRSVDRFVCCPVRRQDGTRPWRRDHPLV